MTRRTAAAEAALGLLCLSAAWPLVEISHPRSVALPMALTVIAVWLVGAALRNRRAATLTIVVAQTLMLLVSALVTLAAHGVSMTTTGVKDAMSSGLHAADGSVAPLQAIPGVITVLVIGAALVALVVDFVGGTSELPAVTVLPVAAPFVLATTAVGHTLPLGYFAAAAFAWAALMWASDSLGGILVRLTPVFVLITLAAVGAAALIAPHVPSRETPAGAQRGQGHERQR